MIELLGWAGSLLLVVSLLQSRMMRLRVLNLIAAIALVVYNLVLFVWPMVAMNLAVAVIDAVQLLRIRAERPEETQLPASAAETGDGHSDEKGRP